MERSIDKNAEYISIHALHTECDCKNVNVKRNVSEISIHALHTECDPEQRRLKRSSRVISIHALHTECDDAKERYEQDRQISIHALHTECDVVIGLDLRLLRKFQSTHSIRSATKLTMQAPDRTIISIHALHTECDSKKTRNNSICIYTHYVLSIM